MPKPKKAPVAAPSKVKEKAAPKKKEEKAPSETERLMQMIAGTVGLAVQQAMAPMVLAIADRQPEPNVPLQPQYEVDAPVYERGPQRPLSQQESQALASLRPPETRYGDTHDTPEWGSPNGPMTQNGATIGMDVMLPNQRARDKVNLPLENINARFGTIDSKIDVMSSLISDLYNRLGVQR